MIFGEIKGLRPQRSGVITVLVILFIIEIFGIAGYLGGFFEPSDVKFLRPQAFQWTIESIIYTTLLCAAWIFAIANIVVSREAVNLKIGIGFFMSIPIVVLVIGLSYT